ncbi:MAG TPA: carboxypeptidase regulatory-like domain-containing protein [Longimicrobiales bacterium]|nr:carboxypeptidase regulatory-like domain-containing protein [Longimicrobiales bacterium]
MKPMNVLGSSDRFRSRCVVAAATSGFLLAAAAAVVPDGLSAMQTGEAVIRGTVVDTDTGRGIDGATVVLGERVRQAVTDSRGRFGFERLRPGRYMVAVERVSYEPRTDTLDVPDGVALELTLRISRTPIALPGINVTVRSLLLEARGFYERERQGFRGVFMDRVAIEDADPIYVADLFRNIPGVAVVDGRLVMSQSVTLRGGGRGCEPSLWLDGIRSGLRNYDYIRPDHLEGVEVYTGGGAPGKYNDLCGTIVIWTRVPVRRR